MIRNIAKALIIREQHLLVTAHASPKESFYALPGGGQEPGETLQETLQRECFEEIGVHVEVGALQYVREFIEQRHHAVHSGTGSHKLELFFSCTVPSGEKPGTGTNPDAHQVGVAWLPLRQIDRYPLYPLALRPILKEHVPQVNTVYLGDIAIVPHPRNIP